MGGNIPELHLDSSLIIRPLIDSDSGEKGSQAIWIKLTLR